MGIKLSQIKVNLPHRNRPLFEIPQLEIARGEKVLIQGPSGIGKTTLIHLMAGLFTADAGYVFIDDRNLNFLSEDERCDLRRTRIGLIFQKLNLLDHLTAEENVGLAVSGDDRQVRIAAALNAVGLTALRHSISAVQSLGEQQRVAAARILAQAPDFILADEPTSSLDDRNADLVVNALLALPRSTLVMVSHDHRLRGRFEKILDFERWVTP